jgi:Mg2+ and Co2+ transporter CorA
VASEPHWIDLCDPDEQSLRAALPEGIHETAMDRILEPGRRNHGLDSLSQGNYVFGVPAFPAARAVLDDRVELDGDVSLFPRDIELHFADAYDKLLRGTDGLALARDLLAGVRDFHQAEIANNQNEVMKRLTAIASMLLVPTFIVGLYGQNFRHIPELASSQGYGFSWSLIIATTGFQLWYFRRKRWI